MIESIPGIESTGGPHGISLLRHAKAGLRDNYGLELSQEQVDESSTLISFLEKLGTADNQVENIEIADDEKTRYLGDYMYGEGPNDGLSIRTNMWNMLALGKLGKTGGSLYQKSTNTFSYNGTTSVEVSFLFEREKVVALTVTEPGLTLKAVKV